MTLAQLPTVTRAQEDWWRLFVESGRLADEVIREVLAEEGLVPLPVYWPGVEDAPPDALFVDPLRTRARRKP